jgi:4-amino-4-deoxy-L-arabinose transferase-like glycosyltransferase
MVISPMKTGKILVLILVAGLGLRFAYSAALAGRINHDRDAAILKKARATGRSVPPVALELAGLTPERAATLLAEWSRLESPGVSPAAVRNTTALNEPPSPGSDPYECEVIAGNLVRGAGYRGISWGQPEEHLTAYRPPVTPVTWALFFAIFGHRFDVIRLVDILYGTASLLLLFLIGRRMFNERVGLMAAAALAVWPGAIVMTGGLMTETLYVMLELLFVWLCLRAGERPTLARFVLAGLCAGLATLTRPNMLLLLPLLPVWSAVAFRGQGHALVKSLAVPAAAVAVIAPWSVRNYLVFHKFIPVSTLSGTNLLIGNNDLALRYPDRIGYYLDDKVPGFAERARGLNEAERDELALQMARSWLRSHRDRWGLLAWSKLKQFWSPFLHQPSRLARWGMLLSWGPVLPLALPTLVATFWGFARKRDAGLIVHTLILSALAGYLIVYAIPRYRFPIEPFFILPAAATADWLVTHLSPMRVIQVRRNESVPAVA